MKEEDSVRGWKANSNSDKGGAEAATAQRESQGRMGTVCALEAAFM